VLVNTALDALEETDGRYGLISICGGAGVASAMVIERLPQ
jgi:acetyl-CoA acetyltransferase